MKPSRQFLCASLAFLLLLSSAILAHGDAPKIHSIISSFPQDQSEIPVWIENATLTAVGPDLSLKVFYTCNITEYIFVTAVNLLLSLDNMSFIENQKHEYDVELTNETDTFLFWLSNSVGRPIPFDLSAGEFLYVWVEMEYHSDATWPGAPPSRWRTPSVSLDVPIDYLAPINIPEIWLQLSVVMVSVLGALGLIFIVARRKAGRLVSRNISL